MKQIICLHIGQAGVQIGDSCWQLFCLEHGILSDGTIQKSEQKINSSNVFFNETSARIHTPRSIFIDLEPTVIDEIRVGKNRKLFSSQHLISGKEDSADNFNRGYYTIGKNIIDLCSQTINKVVDSCDNLQGFLLFHSVNGGTGSGFGSLLLQRLSFLFPKKPKINFIVFPSPNLSTTIVQPYNALLAAHSIIQNSNLTMVLDNQALYSVCQKKLDIQNPSYSTLNRIIAQMVSSTTASLRFDGALNGRLKELQTNLVPYPRIHFMLPSYSPLLGADKAHCINHSVDEMTNEVFERQSMMASCDPRQGTYIACSLMYRGDVAAKQVNTAVCSLKSNLNIRFMDWCPTGFKVGINSQPPTAVRGSEIAKVARACCAISNTTCIRKTFFNIDHKFDLLYAQRAFVHWYVGEGMEEGIFTEARQNLASLQKDYQQSSIYTTQYNQQQ